jgi:hypothetical protein
MRARPNSAMFDPLMNAVTAVELTMLFGTPNPANPQRREEWLSFQGRFNGSQMSVDEANTLRKERRWARI